MSSGLCGALILAEERLFAPAERMRATATPTNVMQILPMANPHFFVQSMIDPKKIQ